MKPQVRQITKAEMRKFGESFKIMREYAGLTLQQLAEELAVHRTVLSKWEKGLIIPNTDIREIEQKIKDVVESRIISDEYLYKKYQFIHKIYSKYE